MKNKKIIAAIIAATLMASVLSSCVENTGPNSDETQDETESATENVSENSSENNSENNSENDSENSSENDSENSSENDSENSSEGQTEYIDPDTIKSYVNPRFSLSGGLYSSEQTLTLTLPEGYEDGYKIFYTTDGNVPTKNSLEYTAPLTLLSNGGSTVIRAACFKESPKDNSPAGKVITNTYIYSENKSSTLWTIAITAHGSELDELVHNYNEDIEIPSHTEMITPDGETVISQDTGLRIFGGSSRSLTQKSFKIIARKTEKLGNDIYTGKGSFSYPLFENRTIRSGEGEGELLSKYDSFILRNGGNDSLQSYSQDPLKPNLLRDGLSNNFAELVTENFDFANSQFAAVYVNGEYYGLLDMRENMNEDYVKNVYGVSDDDVVVIKSELDTSRKCILHKKLQRGDCRFCNVWFFYETDEEFTGYLDEWKKLCEKAINASDKQFNTVFSEIESKIDLDSFAEYVAINLYLCNTDWPHNNVKLWKYIGEEQDGIEITDGKWRFMYRDMDFTMGRYNVPEALAELNTVYTVDTFYRILGNYQDFGIENDGEYKLYPDSLYLQGLFDFCLKNDDFRAQFVEICEKLCSDESRNALLSLLDATVAQVAPAMPSHLERWEGTYSWGYDMDTWYASIEEMREFINLRPDVFREHLYSAMNIYATGTYGK